MLRPYLPNWDDPNQPLQANLVAHYLEGKPRKLTQNTTFSPELLGVTIHNQKRGYYGENSCH